MILDSAWEGRSHNTPFQTKSTLIQVGYLAHHSIQKIHQTTRIGRKYLTLARLALRLRGKYGT